MSDDNLLYVVSDDEIVPPKIPFRRRLAHAAGRIWPLSVWLATVGAAVWLYHEQGAHGQALAYAETVQVRVAPAVPGRVLRVEVQHRQPIQEGDVVATLDTRDLEEKIDLAGAEVERLRKLVAAQREALRVEEEDRKGAAAARLRAHEADAERIRLQIEELSMDQAGERGEIETIAPQIDRLGPLVERRLVGGDRLGEIVARRTILERRMAEREGSLKRLRECLAEWERLRPEPVGDIATTLRLEPVRLELRSEEMRLQQLIREREKYVLRSPAAGYVESVACRQGEWVTPGTEVALIVTPSPGRVTGYVTDRQVPVVVQGIRAVLRPREHGGPVLCGRVTAVGPQIEQVPMRLRFLQTIPQWGRLVTIEVDRETALLPGEIYDVRFEP